MMDKSQVWVKAWNKRTLTLLEEHNTMRPPCLGDKPRERKTQKGTNTNLHNNFIHSNQKWQTSHLPHWQMHRGMYMQWILLGWTNERKLLLHETCRNLSTINQVEEAKQSMEKSPSACHPTAGKELCARSADHGCSRSRVGRRRPTAQGQAVLWAHTAPVF